MPRRRKTTVRRRRRAVRYNLRRPIKGMRLLQGYRGNLAIKRVSNLYTTGGFAVDGTTLVKFQNNLVFTSTVTVGQANYGTASFYAMLSDVTNAGEFTALYDRYTIVGCKLSLTPYSTVASSGAAVSPLAQQPALIMHHVKDYDDVALPSASEAGVDAIRQYTNYRSVNLMSRMGKPINIFFRPRVAIAAYSGAFTSYKNVPFGWCDVASPAVQGYGWKAVFESIGGGSIHSFYFKGEVTYYLKFKNPR